MIFDNSTKDIEKKYIDNITPIYYTRGAVNRKKSIDNITPIYNSPWY